MNQPLSADAIGTLTERESFAAVLGSMVAERCTAAKAPKTSRTGLQSTVPVDERPYVRRGLDALIDIGVLSMTGEYIGVTPQGTSFLAFVTNRHGSPSDAAKDSAAQPDLGSLRKAIAADERLVLPRPIDEIRTLPARLEGYRARRSTGKKGRVLAVLGGMAALAAGFMLMR